MEDPAAAPAVAPATPAPDASTIAIEPETNDRATAEAGAVRGLARSFRAMGGRAVRFPSVGRLPAQAPRMPKISAPRMPKISAPRMPKASAPRMPKVSTPRMTPRPKLPSSSPPRIPTSSTTTIPVKQVAKISDRVSTGWGVWDSANETGAWSLSRLRPFVISLVKNTVLGASVFETYCYMVLHLAPAPPSPSDAAAPTTTPDHHVVVEDEYARASLGVHVVAGACGGAVHGVVGTLWDTVAGDRSSFVTGLRPMILHHASAHAALFGSYELLKRQLLEWSGLDSHSQHGPAYLASVSVAGGVAGQVQHILSHYSEQWLRLEEGGTIPPAAAESTAALKLRPPAWRSVLMAFPASAIGFIAFEYGRSV